MIFKDNWLVEIITYFLVKDMGDVKQLKKLLQRCESSRLPSDGRFIDFSLLIGYFNCITTQSLLNT
jgi:hypothetical protein